MQVVHDVPPMFDEIDAAFDVAGKDVLFAWGDRIYYPAGKPVPAELVAHEEVHSQRQGDDPAAWWRRYIADPAFRLAEEIPAHQAEFAAYCRGHTDRNHRAVRLHLLAQRLASTLYGSMISYPEARSKVSPK